MFYATPIVYGKDDIPQAFSFIIHLNPVAHLINAYRAIFYEQTTPDIKKLCILFIGSVIFCIIGYFIFKKLQKGFAEEF